MRAPLSSLGSFGRRAALARCAGVLAALGLAAACMQTPDVAEPELKRAAVNGGEIEYSDTGAGEPILMIHGTGVAATFEPQHSEPALDGYRLIRVHRRGFAGSSRTPDGFTIADHAADARALLDMLGIEKTHVVGHSFGGMVALQLAIDEPELVHDLVVIEPPVFDASAPPASFLELLATYGRGEKEDAMNTFSTMSYGDEWRELASRVSGGPDQVMADVDTVFLTETPAMMNWGFGGDDAARIHQPILYLTGGTRHGASLPQFKEWIPQLEEKRLPELSHAMLMQDPTAVSLVVADFVSRHPL